MQYTLKQIKNAIKLADDYRVETGCSHHEYIGKLSELLPLSFDGKVYPDTYYQEFKTIYKKRLLEYMNTEDTEDSKQILESLLFNLAVFFITALIYTTVSIFFSSVYEVPVYLTARKASSFRARMDSALSFA